MGNIYGAVEQNDRLSNHQPYNCDISKQLAYRSNTNNTTEPTLI
jgi:hypothetical protein